MASLARGFDILTDDTIVVAYDPSELDGFPVQNLKIKAENGNGIQLEIGDSHRDLGLSLILSAVQWSGAMVRRLIHGGEEYGVTDRIGPGPTLWAALNGNKAVMKFLLGTERVDLNNKDDTGRTPFSWAVTSGQMDLVQLLLENGKVDVDSKDDDGRTLLSWAACYGQKYIVQLLLDIEKADVDPNDDRKQTPLSLAA
ncbi:Protein TANC1 [Penicillium rolfsii]|nr:Protein TANC1 [Penicillium rolfsii]